MSLLMLAAILPTLTYLGHWELVVPLPGDQELTIIAAEGGHTHRHDDDHAAEHARHCHGDAASCSDAPFTGVSAFALLSAAVALLGTAGTAHEVPGGWWHPHRSNRVNPLLRPPRPASLAI